MVRSLFPSRFDAAGFDSRRDLLYVTSRASTFAEGGQERDWLIDGFLSVFPERSVVMQWGEIPTPNGLPAFRDTRSLEPIRLRANIAARLRTDRARVHQSADVLVRRLADLFGDDISEPMRAQAADRAANRELARPSVEVQLSSLLERTQAKVLVLPEATYGANVSLIALAKRRGVVVAEPQHGWIGAAHPAYNFGDIMWDEDFAGLLPDVLLTFGEYWARDLRFPGEVIPIGKPQLEDAAADVTPFAKRPLEILVASSVSHPAATERFVLRLSRLLPVGWLVRFRPHPSERDLIAERYPGLAADSGVVIDTEKDLYRSLRRARVVIGVDSTVLFEALKFDCMIMSRSSASNPYYVGGLFGVPLSDETGPEEAVRRLNEIGEPPSLTADSVWQPDARDNFKRWVDRLEV